MTDGITVLWCSDAAVSLGVRRPVSRLIYNIFLPDPSHLYTPEPDLDPALDMCTFGFLCVVTIYFGST